MLIAPHQSSDLLFFLSAIIDNQNGDLLAGNPQQLA